MSDQDQPSDLDCSNPILHAGAVGLSRVSVESPPTGAPSLAVTLLPANAVVVAPSLIERHSWTLTGGSRLHPQVIAVTQAADDQVELTLDALGDFSVYTLTVTGPLVDPFFASLQLRFRLECEDPFDCRPAPPPAPTVPDEGVVVDYLAKDYASFRQALLDFLPTRAPNWTELSEADVGIALLELLAATGDTLSYQQDRVANEAFIATATQRRSLHDHLAPLGYELDEGATASTWLSFHVANEHRLPAGARVLCNTQPNDPALVFETVAPAYLTPAENELTLFDWGNSGCCLPADATEAALVGLVETLQAGDLLLFADRQSGARDIVRLTSQPALIPHDGVTGAALTVVQWSTLTPLRADYCVAQTVVSGNLVVAMQGQTVTELHAVEGQSDQAQSESAMAIPPSGSPGARLTLVAFGFDVAGGGEQIELVLTAPDGAVVEQQRLSQSQAGGVEYPFTVPVDGAPGIWVATFTGALSGRRATARWVVTGEQAATDQLRPPRLRVSLGQGPLAFADVAAAPDPFRPAPRSAPQLSLTVDGEQWRPLPSLLDSSAADHVFRVETDELGFATLAFGRGGEGDSESAFGLRPPAGSTLLVTYRVGGGATGNVGADTLTIPDALGPAWFQSVTNPLPAAGGRDRETAQHARLIGPDSLAGPLVAVTENDYEQAATAYIDDTGGHPIAAAGAAFRWTGSWLTVMLAVEPSGTQDLAPDVAADVLAYLNQRRAAGYDVDLRPADRFPIQLELSICVAPGFVATEVSAAVRAALSGQGSATDPFFSPQRFGFGDPLALGALFARIQAVPGVQSVSLVTLAGLHAAAPVADTQAARAAGLLTVGPNQILELADDPSFPERGQLILTTVGGQ